VAAVIAATSPDSPQLLNKPDKEGRNDVLDTPGYRFWALLRDQNPVAVFETTGLAFVGDQRLDLMDMYRRDRRLFPVIAAVVGDILP
jgi:hypothetical protein